MISQAVAKRGHPCAALLIVMAAVSVLVDAKSCGFDERYRAKKERKYSAVQFNRTATQTFNESAGVLPSMHLNVSRKIPERSRSRRLTCPFSSSGECADNSYCTCPSGYAKAYFNGGSCTACWEIIECPALSSRQCIGNGLAKYSIRP